MNDSKYEENNYQQKDNILSDRSPGNNSCNISRFTNQDETGEKRKDILFTPIAKNLRARSNRRSYPVKQRQKRQTMQNMTKPLKNWLCKHRTNPYPTKQEKEILASESHMSLTQVANWFANARRRLKSTVKGDNYDWAMRVKLYNTHVDGNAELLSISSEDSNLDYSDDNTEVGQNTSSLPRLEENCDQEGDSEPMEMADKDMVPSRSHTPTSNPSFFGSFDSEGFIHQRSSFEHGSQNKFKQTILQRYLSDTYYQSGHAHKIDMEVSAFNKTRSRRPSGSLGSRDYEEMSTSSGVSLNEFHYNSIDEPCDDLEAAARRRRISGDVSQQEEIRWKEISAAMALTSLARSRKYPHT